MDEKKVLIVDDQAGIRVLLYEVLSNEGYQAFVAANGKEAMQMIEKSKPHLMLLDMKIPGMNGLEILKHTKQKDPNIKVIMMTAYGEIEFVNQAMEEGACMHFTKPFDIDELRKAVKQHMFPDEQLRSG
ncbi:response regulator [Longirhabdus pacifica]|uniref:response regulator n=1 Tax=Longirhabdus pacifica TaxID=2305227 RepID=UPI0023EA653B|nr:response regulator [Longirhabdus pacifica]